LLDRSDVTAEPLRQDGRMPLVVRPARASLEAEQFLLANRAAIDHLLLQHGAILFRGFAVDTIERFDVVIHALTRQALAYEYRSTPRERLGEAIYTASDYPARHTIPMHCENAYQRDWPTKILFACAHPALTGGQTPLADMIAVSRRLSADCFESFRAKGVCYLRNYQEGMDLSWQNVFQTESRDEVGAICRRMGIDPQRVRESILPLSIGDTLPKAFEEWYFTGFTEDHEEPCETCELCGQEGLRYHFEICNGHTGHTLQVGSHCILQFNVAVFEDGQKLSPKEAKRKLDKLTQQMRLESCVRALERLAQAENTDILRNALDYYRKNKKLTPKQAFVVFWRLRQNQIDHAPSFFNVTLRKQRYLNDLEEMDTSRVHFFWHALSASQKQRAIELGHWPPAARACAL